MLRCIFLSESGAGVDTGGAEPSLRCNSLTKRQREKIANLQGIGFLLLIFVKFGVQRR